ncbi:MAG: lasso RiPP family leader peptide-containing protein [Thermoleophilia bacterium]
MDRDDSQTVEYEPPAIEELGRLEDVTLLS